MDYMDASILAMLAVVIAVMLSIREYVAWLPTRAPE